MIDPNAIDTVVKLLLPSIINYQKRRNQPFVLGLSGLQGSGKSTWAAALVSRLSVHGLRAATISLDDLYLDHDDLIALQNSQPKNKLLCTRGHPGTHDEVLAQDFFAQLLEDKPGAPCRTSDPVRWPAYDKSLHAGQGGRVPVNEWELVSRSPLLDVIVFEGWCVGFQPLSEAEVLEKWKRACEQSRQNGGQFTTTTLSQHRLEDLLFVNGNLHRYCDAFMGPAMFDGFLHLSTDNLANVYSWRLDQERALRMTKPSMTDDQVVDFVRGYMPGYELYLDRLQSQRIFSAQGKDRAKHIKVSMDEGRNVVQITEL